MSKNISTIFKLAENGNITELKTYTLNKKTALICFLEQTLNNNFNTSTYETSKFNEKIKLSKFDNYIYDDGITVYYSK